MSIVGSVGAGGQNNRVDVKVIQAALNLSMPDRLKEAARLTVDGINGNTTISSIKTFQNEVLGINNPSGKVDPRSETHLSLGRYLSKGFSKDALRAIMGHGATTTVDSYHSLILTSKNNYDVNTPLRPAHFLAQVGHESLSFTYTEEIASGAAYEGRKDLGNSEKGDGTRFKGRGLIQLTGRVNYEAYGKHIGVDLLKEGDEDLVSRVAKLAVDAAFWFWYSRKLNRYADLDDIRAVTRRVNGGFNGLDDRMRYLERAKFFLM